MKTILKILASTTIIILIALIFMWLQGKPAIYSIGFYGLAISTMFWVTYDTAMKEIDKRYPDKNKDKE